MPREDGGPAFPTTLFRDGAAFGTIGGMSLRDYFAAHALNGLIAAKGAEKEFSWMEFDSRVAYGYADAMLKARE